MAKTITDAFEPYIGTTEYNGIVADIQKWFYGYVYKASWCATSCSYFADQVGVLDQLGGKNENVYNLMRGAETASKKTGEGTFYYRDDIPKGYIVRRGTVVFLLKSAAPMTTTSSKHVTTAYEDFTFTGSGKIKCLGGNQNDGIRVSVYNQGNIYAIFAPDYEGKPEPKTHTTLRLTVPRTKGTEVKALQSALNRLGFGGVTGDELAVDGSYGPKTQKHVIAFQVLTGLKGDGICGPKTWAKIDELLALPKTKATAVTDVYLRKGPGTGYPTLGKVLETETIAYTTVCDGWIYIPALGGWSNRRYYK